MICKPTILVVEPEVELRKALGQVLHEYAILFASDFDVGTILCNTCGQSCFVAVIIEGGVWPQYLQQVQKFIHYVRGMKYTGPVVIIATDPAYPYEQRIEGVDYAIRIGELTRKLSEILAKK